MTTFAPVTEGTEMDAFVALLLADEELVAAEFDAIVAAEWSPAPPDEPPAVPVPRPAGGIPGGRVDGRLALRSGRVASPRPGTDGRSRERSPPR